VKKLGEAERASRLGRASRGDLSLRHDRKQEQAAAERSHPWRRYVTAPHLRKTCNNRAGAVRAPSRGARPVLLRCGLIAEAVGAETGAGGRLDG
jgi:hypothetical protein